MPSKKRSRYGRDTDEEVEDQEDVVMADDTKKRQPRTMTDEDRHLLFQTNHELQLTTAGEQPSDLFLAEYETPRPYRRPDYVPTIYHVPTKKR